VNIVNQVFARCLINPAAFFQLLIGHQQVIDSSISCLLDCDKFFQSQSLKFCRFSFPALSLSHKKIIGMFHLAYHIRTMSGAADQSEYVFEWDLQNIDNSKTRIPSAEFSFQENKNISLLFKIEGETNYGCCLQSVEKLTKPGSINFRFDLLKGLNNEIVKYFQ
jgi:hypothetical protein